MGVSHHLLVLLLWQLLFAANCHLPRGCPKALLTLRGLRRAIRTLQAALMCMWVPQKHSWPSLSLFSLMLGPELEFVPRQVDTKSAFFPKHSQKLLLHVLWTSTVTI